MRHSLWFRLTGTVVFVVVVTMVVALVASLVIMRREFVDFVNTATSSLVVTSGEGRILPEVILPRSSPALEFETVPELPEIIDDRFPNLERFTGIEGFPNVFLEENIPSISIEVPRVVRDEATIFLETMRNSLLLAIGVSGALAIIASTWLFWQITRPLSRVRSAAEDIAAGDLEARVSIKRKDEVGRLGEAFNTMASELERQENSRQQMVADVAHELRTPLSVMRGNLEAMIDDLIPASEGELDALHQEVMRLSSLVEDLRLLSLADAGKLQLAQEDVDVAALVEMAVRRMTPIAKDKGVILAGDIGQASLGSFTGDEGKMQQVLANLTGNAIRHTPPGGQVTIEARRNLQEIQIVVRDQGPGVDPADLPHLFDRFWKSDRARLRKSEIGGDGSGLGLSIVRQLVELHGGRVEATLPENGGLQVTISLPAVETVAN